MSSPTSHAEHVSGVHNECVEKRIVEKASFCGVLASFLKQNSKIKSYCIFLAKEQKLFGSGSCHSCFMFARPTKPGKYRHREHLDGLDRIELQYIYCVIYTEYIYSIYQVGTIYNVYIYIYSTATSTTWC